MATKTKEKPLSKLEKKRVEILQDALAQIKAEKYKVTTGIYIGGEFEESVEELAQAAEELENLSDKQRELLGIKTTSSSDELQKHLDKLLTKKTPCEVCARGAILISDIRNNNNCSLEDATFLDDMAQERSAGVFGKENAEIMECVFESNSNYLEDLCHKADEEIEAFEKLIKAWKKAYPKAENRLIAIFKNAIKNRGIFKPEQLK